MATINVRKRYIPINAETGDVLSVASGGGGSSPSLTNYYTITQLDDGVLDARYYTETELNNGQLDSRYYTETELNAGQLDNRYYTETELNNGQLDSRYFTETESDNRYIQVAGDSMSGTLKGDSFESESVAYSSGFTGAGFSLYKDGTDFNLELDNLTLRKGLKATEFEISRIRSSNGNVWFTSSIKASSDAVWDAVESCYYFETEENFITVEAGNTIKAQAFTGTEIYSLTWVVDSIDTNKVYVKEIGGADISDLGVNGYEFVRISGDSIYVNVEDDDAPYIDFLTDVGTAVSNTNRKVRIGNLDGLEFNGNNIGGPGLYATNSYLEGEIIAYSGIIGGLELGDNELTASGDNGSIVIDADLTEFRFYDADDFIKIKLHNDDIPSISDLGSGSDITYGNIGGFADTYTDISIDASGAPDTFEIDYYIQEYASDGDYIDQVVVGSKNSTYYMDGFTADRFYNVKLDINRKVSTYSVPTDEDEDDLDSTPYDGQIDYYNTYQAYGTFSYQIIATLYDSSDNVLTTQTYNSSSLGTAALDTTDVFTVMFKSVQIPTTTCYIKLEYSLVSNMQIQGTRHWYQYTSAGAGSWNPVSPWATLNYNYFSTLSYYFEVDDLVFDAQYTLTEIGKDGFLSYWSDEKYFALNNSNANTEAAPFIESDGFWVHNGALTLEDEVTVNGELYTDGGVRNFIQTDVTADKTANYTLNNATDQTVTNQGASATITFNLPATSQIGKTFIICNTASATYNILIRLASGTKYIRGGGTSYTVDSSNGYTVGPSESIMIKAITNDRYIMIN